MKKYKLTDETRSQGSITLYRIQALKDFANVKKGDLGGWVESEKNLSQKDNCWVSGDAAVFENALVSGDSWVSGNAKVFEDAVVSGYAYVSGDAMVHGDANVYGYAVVYEPTKVTWGKLTK